MKRTPINGLSLWQFENLEKEDAIRHFVTDRNSHADAPEFTLSLSSSPDRKMIEQNRALVAASMGTHPTHLFFPSQVHETRIVHVTANTSREELAGTDALVTSERGVCIAVMSADCVTILLYDRRNKVVGAVHSGWRGTVAKILEKTLVEMKTTFGTKGEDVTAGIGPSVCQESYEVGGEVVAAVDKAFGGDSGLMIPQPPDKARLDLWKANKLQLLEFGVRDSDIEIAGLCTVKNNEHFFSARKGDAGRFAAGIMLV